MERLKLPSELSLEELESYLSSDKPVTAPPKRSPSKRSRKDRSIKDIVNSPKNAINAKDGSIVVTREGKQNDVLLFFDTFKIKAGTHPIKSSHLYTLYKKWSLVGVSNLSFAQFSSKFLIVKDGYSFINIAATTFHADVLREVMVSGKKRPKTLSSKGHLSFNAFLKHTGLAPGNIHMSLNMIAYLYDRSCVDRKVKSTLLDNGLLLAYTRFYFKQVQTKNGPRFLVSDNIYNYHSKELLEQISRVRDDPQNEKTKKKRRKISSP